MESAAPGGHSTAWSGAAVRPAAPDRAVAKLGRPGRNGDLDDPLFTYPPFAALLFVPLAFVTDTWLMRWRRAGIGVGLVAGIELTRAIFIVYLVLVGRLLMALVPAATFAAAIAIGFVVLPAESRYYWLGRAFTNPHRIPRDPTVSSRPRPRCDAATPGTGSLTHSEVVPPMGFEPTLPP